MVSERRRGGTARNGTEWNGVERGGRRRVVRGWVAEGLRGPEIDNAIPRLPLPPSTKLAPALLSFLLLPPSLLLLPPRSPSRCSFHRAVEREPASFRNVNSINATPFILFFSFLSFFLRFL